MSERINQEDTGISGRENRNPFLDIPSTSANAISLSVIGPEFCFMLGEILPSSEALVLTEKSQKHLDFPAEVRPLHLWRFSPETGLNVLMQLVQALSSHPSTAKKAEAFLSAFLASKQKEETK